MNLRFTMKAIGPREEEVSGGKQTFLSTTVKTVCHAWPPGFNYTRCPARCICICRGLCLEALGGGTYGAWEGRNEVHLKRLLEHGACLMLLSFGLSVQGSNILGERCKQTALSSVCLCPGETRGALPASCPSLRLSISF